MIVPILPVFILMQLKLLGCQVTVLSLTGPGNNRFKRIVLFKLYLIVKMIKKNKKKTLSAWLAFTARVAH